MNPTAKEIRNAGRVIRGFVQFLLERETDPARRLCLEAIQEAAQTIETCVASLQAEE